MKDDFLSNVIFSPVLNWIRVWETTRSKLNPYLRRTRQTCLSQGIVWCADSKSSTPSCLDIKQQPLLPLQWKSHPREEWRFGSKGTDRNLSSPLAHKHKQARVQIRAFSHSCSCLRRSGSGNIYVVPLLFYARSRRRLSLSTALMTAIKSAAIKIDLKRKKENGDILQNNYTHERLNATAVTLRELWHIFTHNTPLWQSTHNFKAFVIAFIYLHVLRSAWFSCFSDTKFVLLGVYFNVTYFCVVSVMICVVCLWDGPVMALSTGAHSEDDIVCKPAVRHSNSAKTSFTQPNRILQNRKKKKSHISRQL